MLFLKRQVYLKRPSFVRNQGTLAAFQQTISSADTPETSSNNNNDGEYTDHPIYPEILDLSYEQRKLRKKQSWHDTIKNIKTVEEKLLKINMPRYYGYKTVALNDNKYPYNCLPLTQHYTRTVFEEVEKLPSEYYQKNSKNVDSFVDYFKSSLQDTIEFAVHAFRRKYSHKNLEPKEVDRIQGEMIVNQINRLLVNSLLADYSHLNSIEIDLNPRHEAFWFVGGVNPSKSAQNMRKGVEWMKKYADEPYDRPVQYLGKPYLALRHKLPLEPIYPNNDAINPDDNSKVPLYKYDSRVIGYSREHRHGTTIPGFWPGSPHEFGLLSYQRRDFLIDRSKSFGASDDAEAVHAHGIQSSFAWLYAQACYQGFSTFHDVTYPLCTQTIITNGQQFAFYVYQLNTTLIHGQHVYDNPRVNYCWGMKDMKLFDEITLDGKCVGLNDEVLRNLIHVYINEPKVRGDSGNLNLKPYLGETEQKIADIKDDERRQFLEKTYKHMTSNRPRHLPIPEIYAWEKIYKVDNKTRQMEPKRRFFELGINPYQRTMDNHVPEYVPRALRPDVPKHKNRWRKTYYP